MSAKHILVVDDNATQLKLASAHLIAEGFLVSTADSVAEALDRAGLEIPDAILSDVVMKDLDGFALCGMLRADARFAGVPIVLMSADVGDDDPAIATAAGAQALVERSPDFRREITAIQRAISGAEHLEAGTQAVSRIGSQLGRLLSKYRQAEDRYHTLFDNASDGIAVLTTEGVILELNKRWEEILGRPISEMVGRHIREFAAPGRADVNVETFRNAVSRNVPLLEPVAIVRPNGDCIYVEFASRVVTVGDETLVVAVGRDVTDAIHARQRLAESEDNYRTLIENLPDVIWKADLGGRPLFMSPRIEQVCGFKPADFCSEPGLVWMDRIHPDDIDAVKAAFGQIRSGEYSAEYRWRHKNGHWIWIRSHASLRRDTDGREVAEGSFSDITDRKRLEDQLRVSQKMEAIGRLTGGIAHDFNNLLAVVLANAEFLQEDLGELDPRRQDVAAITEAGKSAAGLVKQLLAFSRNPMTEFCPINLVEVVGGVEKLLHRVIGEDIQLSIVHEPDLGTIRADAGQIEQVLMNLAVNARDAMPRGGRLTIETRNVSVDETISEAHVLMLPGDYVMVAVSDTGCGMSEATRSRIFEPFFTTKGVGRGTGLGLSTCYGIVQQHGGYIWVYSEVDRGSVFKVYLPRIVEAIEATGTSGVEGTVPGGPETVMVIEDNSQLLTIVRRVLSTNGYRVLEATTKAEALAVHARHAGTIDLILSDVVLPDGTGPEIVSTIRKGDSRPAALFMSGYTDHAALTDGQSDVPFEYVHKPFTPSGLARRVRAALDQAVGAV